ncbi:protein of unknown function [Candidatus Filomicrobium marinum]|uniref:Uncharacterized protein n=1 Tax=Candidatus Filomicrobium marinum TaxID=1608628 RepID=A0A0D6JA91_9HYPH|nr:protein of unknown function [Candidatus Filomicrobium marinum]
MSATAQWLGHYFSPGRAREL